MENIMIDDPLFNQDDAATPLTPEEREGLILSHIALRRELNDAEQSNILEAEQWAIKRKRNILDERFLKVLHKKMFCRVWKWAGQYRQTARNIGVDAWRISHDLSQLLDDCLYWVKNDVYEMDEIAVRYHHRLVYIHPFPNGNGRHARLATDLLLLSFGFSRFSWGQDSLIDHELTRQNYIISLRAADNHDFRLLLNFVRS